MCCIALPSSLFRIHQLRNALDIIPLAHTRLRLRLLQKSSREVVPAELGDETRPNLRVAFIKATAICVAPFEHFLIRAAFDHTRAEIFISHAQETSAAAITAFAEIFVVLGVEFSGR